MTPEWIRTMWLKASRLVKHRQLTKFGALFRRPKLSDDLKAEIRSHLEMEERENLESGLPSDKAHYAALRRFGNVTLAEERSREMWIWNTVETLLQDLRYGLRQLRRSPGLTAVAVLTLAADRAGGVEFTRSRLGTYIWLVAYISSGETPLGTRLSSPSRQASITTSGPARRP